VGEAKGKLTMRSLFILVAISASAFAQSAPPNIGNKRLVRPEGVAP
jgi:hypothetical protein